MKSFTKGSNLISSMNLQQPYTGIVVQAIGVPSKFSTYVKASENDAIVEKYKKIKELEANKEKIPKDLKLSKKEMIIAENIVAKEGMKRKKEVQIKLDPWQEESIERILKGESITIFGPTSGGKTYLVKYAINELKGKVKRAVFIAPTFHLAIQTYSDIQATYSGFPASLITDKINEYHPESWIYVGTAECMLNFLQSTEDTYDVGIFDEIHSINSTVFNTEEDAKRISATHSLLKLCKSQIIALSATVRDADVPRVVKYLTETTGISPIHPVSYKKRAVPQKVYLWNNTKLESPDEGYEDPEYSAENMFNLILTMRGRGMFPTLLFGMEDISFDAFCDLISYMEIEEQREYDLFHRLGDLVNPSIEEFNEKVYEYNDKLAKAGASSTPEIQKLESSIKSLRETLADTIMQKIKDSIRKAVVKETKYPSPLPDWNKGVYIEGVDLKRDDPSPEMVDLCDLFKSYDMILGNTRIVEILPIVPTTKGSFFRFGTNTHHIFNDMRLGRKTEQVNKYKGVMTTMAKAEGLEDKQMWKFIDFIGRGLDFGICSLLKEFPFFIQYQILEMMKEKHIAAAFASESMSMGINYPFRSVVVFSKTAKTYPVSKMLQMSGRCGRRGLDTKSYVVYWGIENFAVEGDPVERIHFPSEEYSFEKRSVVEICGGTKEEAQASFVRYYKDYNTEEKEIIRDWYKKRCVADYKKAYNL